MNLNQQLDLIRQSATVSLNDRIVAARAAGKRILPLHVGDPDFPTPAPVVQAASRALQAGLTHYGPSAGDPELRRAAALKLARDNGLEYDPQAEILVTHGGIHAYYLAMQSILNPGDDVPDSRPHLGNACEHGAPAARPCRSRASPPGKRLPALLRGLGAGAHASQPRHRHQLPLQPDRHVSSRAYLQQLREFAAAHDLWVVSDEVYENLYYEEKPVSAAAFPGAQARTLLVHSLSKTYAMTGWRVGYLAAPARVIEQALKAGQNSITCVARSCRKPLPSR